MTSTSREKECIAVVGNLAQTQLGFRGELIKDMIRAGHEVLLFASDFTDETRNLARAMGAEPVDYYMSRKGLNPLADMYSLLQLYRLFKKYNVSVTLCSFAKPVVWGTVASWLAKVPKRIAKIEGLGRYFVEPPGGMKLQQRIIRCIMLLLFRFSLPKAHKVFVLNPDDRHDLNVTYGLNLPHIEVLGGIGVCLKEYRHTPAPIEPIRFIFVGRLLKEKGIRYYLEAAKAVKAKFPHIDFVVLGEPDGRQGGVTRKELKTYIDAGVVNYPGHVHDVVKWLENSSVFVLPSYYREGVPRSTQEALAVGRAVITTDMPGCRETVEHGINGLLIPSQDQTALTQAMEQLILRPSQVIEMGRASQRLAEKKFNVRDINKRILTSLNGM